MLHSQKSHVLETIEDMETALDERVFFEAAPEGVKSVRLFVEELRTEIAEAVNMPEPDRELALEKTERMLEALNFAILLRERQVDDAWTSATRLYRSGK